jgi:hypothetical protein
MKALNTKERNSAILKFSLWMAICVVIICLPIILIPYLSGQKNQVVSSKSQDDLSMLTRVSVFQKDTLSVQLSKIAELIKKAEDSDNSKIESINDEIKYVVKSIESQTASKTDWRGDMYRNITAISDHVIQSNRVLTEGKGDIEKIQEKLDGAKTELESIGEEIKALCHEYTKKDFHKGILKVDADFTKAMKMLNSIK